MSIFRINEENDDAGSVQYNLGAYSCLKDGGLGGCEPFFSREEDPPEDCCCDCDGGIQTIIVDDEENIVFDDNSTLTIVEGDNVEITTDDSTNTLTIDVTTGGTPLTVEDEGVVVDSNVAVIDFVGVGVIATQESGQNVTVTVDGQPDQNLFETISVANELDVVATSTTDTLTLVEGTGIEITTDGVDTVTITNTAVGALLDVEDEGVSVEADTRVMDFVGTGVTTFQTAANNVEVNIPGGPIAVEDEGVNIEADALVFDFVGDGVTATQTAANNVEINIPAPPGGGFLLDVEDEGLSIEADTRIIDFVGPGVTVTSTGANEVEVNIPGGAGPDTNFLNTSLNSVPPNVFWDHDFLNSEMGWDNVKNFFINADNDSLTSPEHPQIYFQIDPSSSFFVEFTDDAANIGGYQALTIDDQRCLLESRSEDAGNNWTGSFDISTGQSISMTWEKRDDFTEKASVKISDENGATVSGLPEIFLFDSVVETGNGASGMVWTLINPVSGESGWKVPTGGGGGGGAGANPYRVMLTRSSNWDINGVLNDATPITWDTEEYDVGNWHTASNAHVTVPVGVTHVRITAGAITTITPGYFEMTFRKNGSVVFNGNPRDNTGLSNGRENTVSLTSGIIPVSPGDQLDVVFSNQDPIIEVLTSQGTFFCVEDMTPGLPVGVLADEALVAQTEIDIDCTGYDSVEITLQEIGLSVSGLVAIRVSTDGISYDATANDYTRQRLTDAENDFDSTFDNMSLGPRINSTTNISGVIRVTDMSDANYKTKSDGFVGSSAANSNVFSLNFRDAAQTDTHLRILPSAGGTFNAGRIRVIGVR